MDIVKIDVKLLAPGAVIPTQGSAAAAGYDLYVPAIQESPITIPAHTTLKVNTEIAIAIPEGKFGAIFARSGLATKNGLRPANCVGVVDSDYRGPIIVALHNDTDQEQFIIPGQRIAQLIIMDYTPVTFELVDELDTTERGAGGFGSTGK